MICLCLNNLRSESWMDAEYGIWSFEGMTLLWRCCKIENFSGQEELLFERLCILLFWIHLQDSGLVTTAGFALGGRWASNRLKERRTWTGWKNIFWRWRLQDFDNYPGQAKYVFLLRIVQTVALKNCRTCAAIACYVRKLDQWFQEERSYLIMRS